MSFYTGSITGGSNAGGGIIRSYNGNMVINLVEGSIYIQWVHILVKIMKIIVFYI